MHNCLSSFTIEELPHIRGQEQKPGGPHAQRAPAKRSYATSEVRGSSRECQAATAQERQRRATQVRGQGWPGGATPHLRLGVAARGATLCPRSEARQEELPHALGQGRQPGGPTPHSRSGGCGAQEGLEVLSQVEGQERRP